MTDIAEAYQRAIEHHQSGRFQAAEALYRDILSAHPDHAGSLHLLGVLALQFGRHDLALEYIDRSIRIEPSAEQYANLAATFCALKREAEAEQAFRTAMRLYPRFAPAYGNLGNLLRHLGRKEEALECLRTAAQLTPHAVAAHNSLGNALFDGDRLEEAEVCFQAAADLDPTQVESHLHLATVLQRLRRFAEAEERYRIVLRLKPDFAEAYSDLGCVLCERNRLDEAEALFRTAIRLKPDLANAHYNLGNTLTNLGRLLEAEECLNNAIRVSPDFAGAHNNLGHTLTMLGRTREAEACFRSALGLNPDLDVAHSNVIFCMDLHSEAGPELQQAERRRWYKMHAERFLASIQPHKNTADSERPLRIGYVSADFRGHSAGYAARPILRHHDHMQFTVFCYSNATPSFDDDVTQELRAMVDHWRPVFAIGDDDMAEQIRQDRIDILVDLSGHSGRHRLLVFARKPAPIQITAWGHATGTGMATMDYLFADPVAVPPDIRQLFAESVIDLPSPVCYEPPKDSPDVSPLPALERKVVTFGSLNRLGKLTDETLDLWARVLQAVPGARLLIKDRPLSDATVQARLCQALTSRGIAEERLHFAGSTDHRAHLATYAEVDIALDPFPQNGGISTLEALWLGVPVVTLLGSTVPARIGGSLLTALELPEWIARHPDEYVAIAAERALDPVALARLRRGLRPRLAHSIIGDPLRYTRAVETLYREVWRRWCSRQP